MPNWIIRQYGEAIGANGLALYTVLAMHANSHGEAYPTIETAGAMIGISRSTTKRTLRLLRKAGLVQVAPRRSAHGFQASNIYLVKRNPEGHSEPLDSPPEVQTEPLEEEFPEGLFEPLEVNPEVQNTEGQNRTPEVQYDPLRNESRGSKNGVQRVKSARCSKEEQEPLNKNHKEKRAQQAARTRKTRDEKPLSDATKLFREIVSLYTPVILRPDFDSALEKLGREEFAYRLKCAVAAYRPNNHALQLEWLAKGVPERYRLARNGDGHGADDDPNRPGPRYDENGHRYWVGKEAWKNGSLN